MESSLLASPDLDETQFRRVVDLLYKHAGIALNDGKQALVAARLRKRMRACSLPEFGEYLDFVSAERSGDELRRMIDVLTTNKTSFFREEIHFQFLRETIVPELDQGRRSLRIWSAGCSTGQEAYTIVMVLRETLKQYAAWDFRLLATDLSDRVIDQARQGVYERKALGDVSEELLRRHFVPIKNSQYDEWQVKPELRTPVSFAHLNLMGDWPMSGPFDVIFCRNVMIYFDKPTQEKLINRFHDLLGPGGYLLIGHSESINGLDHAYQYIQPATYRKLR